MARGDFLRGLSEGIFERLGQLRKEQETRDENTKADTIKMLAGFADKVEPESLPILMRHLGDVIGVKGKLKGFWDAFSGMPNRSVEDQLGTTLRDFSSGLVGSETAKKARAGGDLARLFQPQTPEQQANRAARIQSEKDLEGKMVVRDPRAEKLSELEAKYQGQAELLAEKMNLQNYYTTQLEGVKQKHREDLAELRSDLRAGEAQGKLVKALITQAGAGNMGYDEATQIAGDIIARQGKANLDRTLGQIDLLAELALKARQERKGGGAGKPMTQAQQAQIDQEITGEAQKIFGALQQGKQAANELARKRTELTKTLSEFAKSKGITFNPQTGLFEGDPFKVAQAGTWLKIMNPQRELLKEYKDLQGKEGEAKQTVQTEFEKLTTQRYKGHVQIGATPDEPISLTPKRTAKRPAPAQLQLPTMTPQKPGETAPRTDPQVPFTKIMRVPDPKSFKIGQEVPMQDGKTWKVTGIGRDHVRLAPLLRQ